MAGQQQHFNVSGMKGAACEQKVSQAIQSLDPQARVSASAANSCVDVQTTQSRQQVGQAIEQAGYSVQT